jgi:hypothetical protein
LGTLKNDFLSGLWHFPFDIFEAIFEHWKELMRDPDEVASRIRNALERENQAHTFVGGRFVERMTPQEVELVETALNSIKESISAVEAAARFLTKRENATLPDALKLLDNQRPLHPAFKEALVKLYGWTSDEGGIRHAIKDAENVERADAQFMLVACSAFVNYLVTR